ncbi:periplasmic binding protein-like II [Crepidotus variabilis]|uniref:Periplasmic binding protein-like II n=1 Tax=Crepidotus variabilis TaxID=179855 RepID=A0A9P6EPY0_9AGAR|nr:periplasmic binding protein-like II [Crepidotus variabilis]
MILRIGYVREHFSTPLLQFAEQDAGKTFELVECPSGTGQLISRLTNDEIDVAIALTDALITGIAKGSKAYKLVGSYVSSPLNWAVITGTQSKYNSIADLKDTTIGISRYGSGSQVMAYVMAFQNSWPTDNLKFQVNNDIRGLINSVNDGSTSAFMWEWFTTKPFVDKGEARFIGSVPTPWQSWLIAAQSQTSAEAVTTFLSSLTKFVNDFNSEESRKTKNIPFIEEKFGYPKEDIEAWMKTVDYPSNLLEIPSSLFNHTLSILEKAGVVSPPSGGFQVDEFVNKNVVKLV